MLGKLCFLSAEFNKATKNKEKKTARLLSVFSLSIASNNSVLNFSAWLLIFFELLGEKRTEIETRFIVFADCHVFSQPPESECYTAFPCFGLHIAINNTLLWSINSSHASYLTLDYNVITDIAIVFL